MQATLTSSHNLRVRLAKGGTGLIRCAIALAYFIILFLGWDLLVWAITSAWTHNFDSAPWRDGGWWTWRNGITSPTLQLLLTGISLSGFLDSAELSVTKSNIMELLVELFHLLCAVLALSGGIGFAAFVLSWAFQLCDQAISWLGLGGLF